MRRKFYVIFTFLMFSTLSWATIVNGKLPGAFSVNSTTQVWFSQGNLQYQASTGTWRFAEHQYDFVGDASIGNVYENVVKCNNNFISASYSGWIDLFGWATSGNLASGVSYQPYSTDGQSANYGPAITSGEWIPENSDWGIVNADQLGAGWRVLTKNEWVYLMETRSASTLSGTANARFAKAYLFGTIHGLIIFPDEYVHPSGVAAPTGVNSTNSTAWAANQYNAADWGKMEDAGAVFLPITGLRSAAITSMYEYGMYWSSTSITSQTARLYRFYEAAVGAESNQRSGGFAVRLVSENPPASKQEIIANQDPLCAGDYYSTFYHGSVSYALPAGTEAYVATLEDGILNLTVIAQGGDVIPADNAVILKAQTNLITLTPSEDAAVIFTAINHLRGTDEPMASPSHCYVLSGHTSDNSIIGVGFYQFSGTLVAHKAYITNAPSAVPPRRLPFSFTQTSGATDIERAHQEPILNNNKLLENGQLVIIYNEARYNAQGQRIK